MAKNSRSFSPCSVRTTTANSTTRGKKSVAAIGTLPLPVMHRSVIIHMERHDGINRKTGNRLRQQLIDEETREPIDGYEKARGYEIGRASCRERVCLGV